MINRHIILKAFFLISIQKFHLTLAKMLTVQKFYFNFLKVFLIIGVLFCIYAKTELIKRHKPKYFSPISFYCMYSKTIVFMMFD